MQNETSSKQGYQSTSSYRGNCLDGRGVDERNPLVTLAVALHYLRHDLAAQWCIAWSNSCEMLEGQQLASVSHHPLP